MNEIERLREKAGHDEAQALHTAELKGEIKGRAKAKAEKIGRASCRERVFSTV